MKVRFIFKLIGLCLGSFKKSGDHIDDIALKNKFKNLKN